MAVRTHGLFRKVDRPMAGTAMGGCYVDHSAGAGVDTGVLIEFEGTLFLSLNTIKELAEVAGFSVNTEALKLERDLAHAQHDNERQRIAILELEAQLDEVARTYARARKDQR